MDKLDGTRLEGMYAGDRLKKFYPRTGRMCQSLSYVSGRIVSLAVRFVEIS